MVFGLRCEDKVLFLSLHDMGPPYHVVGCGDCILLLRLISVEDVRNYLSHIIYILIFDFFLNFLSFVRLQTPTSRCWKEV